MSSEDIRQPWPQIGDIVPNHDARAPSPVRDLEGRRFVYMVDGRELTLAFDHDRAVHLVDGDDQRLAGDVFALRPDLYFVDVAREEKGKASVFLIDDSRGRILIVDIVAPAPDRPADVLARIATFGSQSAVSITYRHGVERPTGNARPFDRSPRLIGKQYRYTYSDTHVYDHFYLSEHYYAWFCREGPDRKLGDFEEVDFFEIDNDLVLTCWREKLLPCVGIMVEDHRIMRSMGKIFGANSITGDTDNAIVGADIGLIADIAGGCR